MTLTMIWATAAHAATEAAPAAADAGPSRWWYVIAAYGAFLTMTALYVGGLAVRARRLRAQQHELGENE